MREWNLGQRLVLLTAVVVGLAFFVFPPTGRPASYGRNTWAGYRYLFEGGMIGYVTDWPRLLLQYALLTVLAWFLIGWTGRKQSPSAKPSLSKPRGEQGTQAGAVSTLSAEISYAKAWIEYQVLEGAVAFEEFWEHVKATFGVGEDERDHFESVFEHVQQEVEVETLVFEARLTTRPAGPRRFAMIAERLTAAYKALEGPLRSALTAIGIVLGLIVFLCLAWPDGAASVLQFMQDRSAEAREHATRGR